MDKKQLHKMMDIIAVDITCNDGRNGMFTGKFEGLHFDNCLLSPNTFDDDGFVCKKLRFEKNIMILDDKFILPFLERYTCPASWVGETILITRDSLAELLNYLRKSKEYDLEEGQEEIWNKWEHNEDYAAGDFTPPSAGANALVE